VEIRIERSGGLAGIATSREMGIETLPSSMTNKVHEILNERNPNASKAVPKGSADQFNYKITIRDGIDETVIECSEYNMSENLRELIGYIERHTKK
jgi:hypothetical protein